MHRWQSGFTLVEILIVVLLLSIVAMVTIPQFTSASDEAQTSALESNLMLLRKAIELYKGEHAGRPPHVDEKGQLAADDLVVRIVGRTDADGKINAAGIRGPYLSEWPANPFVDVAVGRKVVCGAESAPRDDTSGWYYCTTTGIIHVNSSRALSSAEIGE